MTVWNLQPRKHINNVPIITYTIIYQIDNITKQNKYGLRAATLVCMHEHSNLQRLMIIFCFFWICNMIFKNSIYSEGLLELYHIPQGARTSHESTLCCSACLLSVNYSSNCVNAASGSTRMENCVSLLDGLTDGEMGTRWQWKLALRYILFIC